jgi:hypothetical protein
VGGLHPPIAASRSVRLLRRYVPLAGDLPESFQKGRRGREAPVGGLVARLNIVGRGAGASCIRNVPRGLWMRVRRFDSLGETRSARTFTGEGPRGRQSAPTLPSRFSPADLVDAGVALGPLVRHFSNSTVVEPGVAASAAGRTGSRGGRDSINGTSVERRRRHYWPVQPAVGRRRVSLVHPIEIAYGPPSFPRLS